MAEYNYRWALWQCDDVQHHGQVWLSDHAEFEDLVREAYDEVDYAGFLFAVDRESGEVMPIAENYDLVPGIWKRWGYLLEPTSVPPIVVEPDRFHNHTHPKGD